MKIQPLYHRHSIRLKNYDYSSDGLYFLTLWTHQRQYLFGHIIDKKRMLNKLGQIVLEEWQKSVNIRAEIQLDAFVIMPNHIHGILVLENPTNFNPVNPCHLSKTTGPKKHSISSFVAGFKSSVTRRINQACQISGKIIWQRNYHEHIIRSELSLYHIREYIENNPMNWEKDQLNLSNIQRA